VSVIGGVNALWGDGKSFNARPWEQQVMRESIEHTTTYNFTDTFTARDQYVYSTTDPMGNPVTPRAPGDDGTFTGLPLPSPLIPNEPMSHTRLDETLSRVASGVNERRRVGQSTTRYWNEVDLDVDTEAFQLFIGGQVALEKEKASLFVSGKATLNFLEVDVERHERLMSEGPNGRQVLQTWRDQDDDQEVALGLGVGVGAIIYLNEQWFLRGEYGVDWIIGEAQAQVGPNQQQYDASGSSGKHSLGRDL
ncbi:MAG: hypothetical protein AAF492_06390, partial [Verrucomicrobiota bacterium]